MNDFQLESITEMFSVDGSGSGSGSDFGSAVASVYNVPNKRIN